MSGQGERRAAGPADLAGAPVTVAGLGLFGGGVATVRWLVGQGADVTVTDLRGEDELAAAVLELDGLGARFVLGRHEESDFRKAALVVANPAVPQASPFLRAAREADVPVTSEMELFLERTPARVALVTGTHGKSSTCHFLARLVRPLGVRVHLGGNIGNALLADVADMAADDVAVVEISSYQLEALSDGVPPRAEVAAITNIAADHLERHGTAREYAAVKRRILPLVAPGGTAFIPPGCDRTGLAAGVRCVEHGPGAALSLNSATFTEDGVALGRVDALNVPGAFQRDNALLALGMAHALGTRPADLATGIAGLTALPHRLEDLGEHRGRRVIDNGVSTTPDSTLAALASMPGPCTLLLGGRAKLGLGFEELAEAARRSGTRVVAFGHAADGIAEPMRAAGVQLRVVERFDDAVRAALEWTPPGGRILFSPACASFDAFPNFRARALRMRELLTTP